MQFMYKTLPMETAEKKKSTAVYSSRQVDEILKGT